MNWTKILKFLIFVGVAVLLYVPFIVSNSLFFPYITGKAYTFRIVTEIIFFLYLIMALIEPDYRPKKSWIFYTFGFFTLSIFVSNIFGANPLSSFWSNFERMEGWVTLAHLFALFVALYNSFNKKEDWLLVFNGSLFFSIFMIGSAFGDIFENGWNYRVNTTLGNSTYLGIYALMNAFIAILMLVNHLAGNRFDVDNIGQLFIRAAKSWQVWVYKLLFLLNTIVMFQTGTRGSMLGWFGGLVLMGILMIFLNKGNKKAKISAAALVVMTLVFLGGIFVLKDSPVIQNNAALKRITDINPTEGTAAARITNWQIALEGVKERPILGWGQSNFNYVFDKYYLPEHYGNETWFDRAHNIIFDWWIAGGTIGLALYLAIWIALVLTIFKTEKLSANEKSVMIGLLAAYFFHNLFVFDQIVSYIYFVLFLAFAASFTDREFGAIQKNLPEKTIGIIGAILIIILPISIYSINSKSLEANNLLISAMRLTARGSEGQMTYYHENGLDGNIEKYKKAIELDTFGNSEIVQRMLMMSGQVARVENIPSEKKGEFIQLVVDEMRNLIQSDPENSRHHYMLGIFFSNLNQPAEAEKALLRAIELSPQKQGIRMPLIRIYYATDQAEKALNLARETYELDTTKDDLWNEYMLALQKFDKAEFQRLLDLEQATLSEGGSINRLEKWINTRIDAQPESYQNHISLAALYLKANMREKSLEKLTETKELFPDLSVQIQGLIEQIEAGENPLGQTISG